MKFTVNVSDSGVQVGLDVGLNFPTIQKSSPPPGTCECVRVMPCRLVRPWATPGILMKRAESDECDSVPPRVKLPC